MAASLESRRGCAAHGEVGRLVARVVLAVNERTGASVGWEDAASRNAVEVTENGWRVSLK